MNHRGNGHQWPSALLPLASLPNGQNHLIRAMMRLILPQRASIQTSSFRPREQLCPRTRTSILWIRRSQEIGSRFTISTLTPKLQVSRTPISRSDISKEQRAKSGQHREPPRVCRRLPSMKDWSHDANKRST